MDRLEIGDDVLVKRQEYYRPYVKMYRGKVVRDTANNWVIHYRKSPLSETQIYLHKTKGTITGDRVDQVIPFDEKVWGDYSRKVRVSVYRQKLSQVFTRLDVNEVSDEDVLCFADCLDKIDKKYTGDSGNKDPYFSV